ncbi:hypothetical protein LA080_002474 [Diaporthe eres]|nr:hypothetical protein LA080_002474 [Diaporthe eres]
MIKNMLWLSMSKHRENVLWRSNPLSLSSLVCFILSCNSYHEQHVSDCCGVAWLRLRKDCDGVNHGFLTVPECWMRFHDIVEAKNDVGTVDTLLHTTRKPEVNTSSGPRSYADPRLNVCRQERTLPPPFTRWQPGVSSPQPPDPPRLCEQLTSAQWGDVNEDHSEPFTSHDDVGERK